MSSQSALIMAVATAISLGLSTAVSAHTLRWAGSDVVYPPVHHQILNRGMADSIEFPVQLEDQPHFKFLTYAN